MNEEIKRLQTEVKEMRQKIFDLQGMLLFGAAQQMALKELSTILWANQKVRVHPSDPIEVVLRRMEFEHADRLFATLADSDPNAAATLKKYLELLRERDAEH